jgi:hypothetical protein
VDWKTFPKDDFLPNERSFRVEISTDWVDCVYSDEKKVFLSSCRLKSSPPSLGWFTTY